MSHFTIDDWLAGSERSIFSSSSEGLFIGFGLPLRGEQHFQLAAGQQQAAFESEAIEHFRHFDLGVRVVGHFAASARTDAQGIVVDDAVLLVFQLDGHVVDPETVGPCPCMNPGPQRGVERPQGPVIQKTQKIAKQADIDT